MAEIFGQKLDAVFEKLLEIRSAHAVQLDSISVFTVFYEKLNVPTI